MVVEHLQGRLGSGQLGLGGRQQIAQLAVPLLVELEVVPGVNGLAEHLGIYIYILNWFSIVFKSEKFVVWLAAHMLT